MGPAPALAYLTSVVGNFQGRLISARLAFEGIESELRNASDGMYPLATEVQVFVRASELVLAREVLLADAVDAAFSQAVDDAPPRRRRRLRWRAAR